MARSRCMASPSSVPEAFQAPPACGSLRRFRPRRLPWPRGPWPSAFGAGQPQSAPASGHVYGFGTRASASASSAAGATDVSGKFPGRFREVSRNVNAARNRKPGGGSRRSGTGTRADIAEATGRRLRAHDVWTDASRNPCGRRPAGTAAGREGRRLRRAAPLAAFMAGPNRVSGVSGEGTVAGEALGRSQILPG
jgi:hypothetical protein